MMMIQNELLHGWNLAECNARSNFSIYGQVSMA